MTRRARSTSVLRSLRALIREERAAAMVEFSIAAMLMVVVVFGTIDWARFFYVRGQLAEVVRDSARYAATLTETSADTAAVGAYARALIANTSITPTGGTLTVSFAGTTGVDRRVRVSLAGFPFTRVSPIMLSGRRAVQIAVAAEFRREQP